MPSTPATGTASARRAKRKKYGSALKLTRRLHLYFGLILLPFVLLYGITALLFNHQSWFSTTATTSTDPALTEAIVLPTAEELAREVTASLNEDKNLSIELVNAEDSQYSGEFIIDFKEDDGRSRYRINPRTREGTIQFTPTSTKEEIEFPFPEEIDLNLKDDVDVIVKHIEEHTGKEKGNVRVIPDLEFEVIKDGTPWTLEYDLKTGKISGRPSSEPSRSFTLRSLLLRLHVSRGYPGETGVRTIWAIIVDIMSALMIFWALSGLIMWWQLRPTRRAGMIALVAGIAFSLILGYAMMRLIYY